MCVRCVCVIVWCCGVGLCVSSFCQHGYLVSVFVLCECGFVVCLLVCGVVVLLYVLMCCFKKAWFEDVLL